MVELQRIAEKFLYKEREVTMYGDFDQSYLNNLIKNMLEREEPDIFSVFDDKVIGIEHFEFDSFKNTKSGSEMKRYEQHLIKTGEPVDHNKIANMLANRTIDQYYNNFKKHFLNHYDKIKKYKSKLKEKYPDKDIEIYFFVEDTSLYGNFCYKDNKIYPLLPIYSQKNLEMLKKCEEVKYIFFFSEKVYDKKNHYFDEQLVIFKNDEKNRNIMKVDNTNLKYCKCLVDINEKKQVRGLIET
ncbi:MAG: hypothetical protein R3Y13_05415 [bacterium]